MLTAKTKDGQIFILTNQYSREQLIRLRRKQQFYCPVCEAKLILKIGTKKIPHFAHEVNENCSDSYDRESQYHMLGKLKLFNWLSRLGTSPQLEKYFPKINQRADLVFTNGGKTYAIEFQCSPISNEIFLSRTRGYRKIDVTPIWLLGGKNIKRLKANKVSITPFNYLFLKYQSDQYYLLAYCPMSNIFIFLEQLISISPQMAYTSIKTRKSEQMTLDNFLKPQLSLQGKSYDWLSDLVRMRTKFWMYRTPAVNQLLLNLYERSINPHLLPPYLGIPLTHNHLIETNPLIWQTYLIMDDLKNESVINFHNSYILFLKLIREGQIKLRMLPQITRKSINAPVKEFFDTLVALHILKKQKEHIYEITQPFQLAKSFDEWERQLNLFKHSVKKFGVTGMIR